MNAIARTGVCKRGWEPAQHAGRNHPHRSNSTTSQHAIQAITHLGPRCHGLGQQQISHCLPQLRNALLRRTRPEILVTILPKTMGSEAVSQKIKPLSPCLLDAGLPLVQRESQDEGALGWVEKTRDGSPVPYDRTTLDGAGPGRGNFEVRVGGAAWPCQKPPWGRLTAVSTATGDFAWQIPLGSPKDFPTPSRTLVVPRERALL